MLKLKAEKRASDENLDLIRKSGYVPAIFYGPKQSSTSIKIKESEFIKVFKEAGESSIVSLNDGSEDHETLIHDLQVDPVSNRPIHADFYVIEKGKKVQVAIPLVFVGQSPAEKTLGGVLIKVMHELEIEAMPKDLPHELEVNIDSLVDFDSQIHASDIKLPAGVELISNPEEVVILVQEAKEEVIEEAPAQVDMSAIEVEKKGKEEETPAE